VSGHWQNLTGLRILDIKTTEGLVRVWFFEKYFGGVYTRFTTKPLKGPIVRV
jgi:hypothetical protein